MTIWKPINFEGVITLDKSLYVQLDQFLYEKEGSLGEAIVFAINIIDGNSQLLAKEQLHMKLSEAMEVFEKRIRELESSSQLPNIKDFQKTLNIINENLWTYVETLENSVVELFQQLDQIGIEKWQKETASFVNSIKIMLTHRIEDVLWAISHLEKLLWKYKESCKGDENLWYRLKKCLPWFHLLDADLSKNLVKSKKFLEFRHKKFSDRMLDYNQLDTRINQNINKFQSYHAFNTLEFGDQEKFKRLYQLLKLWDLNQVSHSLPPQDIVGALRHVQNEERNYQLFRNYYNSLKDALYHQARLFKLGSEELWKGFAGKTLTFDLIAGYRQEVHTLGATILKYRDFILRTDPNPYIRSRWGFGDWVSGQEPQESKRLLGLAYEVESLDKFFAKLQNALDKGPSPEEEALKISKASDQITYLLRESSQPLISQSMMHANVERITNTLAELDELSSFNKEIIGFVGQILSKTLRADWKYNVSFSLPKFQEIYKIHINLIDGSEDRQHLNRIGKFKHIIQQIEEWSMKKVTQRHIYEIEQDMSDIKVYLQDFLAYVQRVITGSEGPDSTQSRAIIEKQLLEYRYLFGQFLYHLTQNEPDERTLRNQFLFIYQYFEAVENKLHENS